MSPKPTTIVLLSTTLLLLITLISSQSCFYSNKFNTCAHYSSQFQYCKQDTLTCEPFTEAKMNEAAGATQRCIDLNGEGTFKYLGRCRQFVPQQCTVTAAGDSCSAVAEFRDQKCMPKNTDTAIVPRKEGETCGSNDKDGKARNCGHNLVCNSRRVCQQKAKLGEACGTAYVECVAGAVCEQRKCVPQYTVPFDGNCETDSSCATGYCNPQTNKCGFNLLSALCLRDYECSVHSPYSVCLGSDGKEKQGTCTKNYFPQANALGRCLAENCATPYGVIEFDELCAAKKCNTEFAAYQCSMYCGKSVDERINANYEYNFDCKEFKAIPWSETGSCKITRQFSECDEDVFNRMAQVSGASRVGAVGGALMALIAFAALVLMQ